MKRVQVKHIITREPVHLKPCIKQLIGKLKEIIRERETETERDKERERQKETETETEKERDRDREREMVIKRCFSYVYKLTSFI